MAWMLNTNTMSDHKVVVCYHWRGANPSVIYI